MQMDHTNMSGGGNGQGGGNPNRKRVLCPITTKDGRTFWLRLGAAYENRDSSMNVYLDGLPINGRLQIRNWDDPPPGSLPPPRGGGMGLGPGSLSSGDPSSGDPSDLPPF
jgi:hypothetical protein